MGRGEHKQTSCHISQQQINSTPRGARYNQLIRDNNLIQASVAPIKQSVTT